MTVNDIETKINGLERKIVELESLVTETNQGIDALMIKFGLKQPEKRGSIYDDMDIDN